MTPEERGDLAEHLQIIIASRENEMTWQEIDELFGSQPGTSYQCLRRARRAAKARGEVRELKIQPPLLLREEQVAAMREASQAGAEDAGLALGYGISRAAVSRAVTGTAYAQYGGPIRTACPKRPKARLAVVSERTAG